MTLTKTRIFTLLTVAFCLVAGLAVSALAQGPGRGHGGPPGVEGHRGHRAPSVERLARFLELTDEQIEAAKAIRKATAAQVEPVREAQKALHEELRSLLDADSPDATAIGEVAIELHQGREQIHALREQAKADFEALLTAEQLEKLEGLKDVRGH